MINKIINVVKFAKFVSDERPVTKASTPLGPLMKQVKNISVVEITTLRIISKIKKLKKSLSFIEL